jgi:hypothetical protein
VRVVWQVAGGQAAHRAGGAVGAAGAGAGRHAVAAAQRVRRRGRGTRAARRLRGGAARPLQGALGSPSTLSRSYVNANKITNSLLLFKLIIINCIILIIYVIILA